MADPRELEPIKTREFLQEIAALSQSLRAEIEAKAKGLTTNDSDIRARRQRVLKDGDFRFFCYNYFPHHLWGDASEFQEFFFTRFPASLASAAGCREWYVAPRGEAKSTLLTKIGPVWIAVQALLQQPKIRQQFGIKKIPAFLDYVMLLGAEAKMPAKLVEVVKTELTVNPALMMDFPEVCGASDNWKIGDIVTRSGVKIESYGADQAMRGTFHGASRPKVLLGDDIITDKEAKSPTERNNRWDWLENAVDYLGPPDGSVKFLGVGTILNPDDVISRAKKAVGYLVHHFKALISYPLRMDLWEQCEELMRNDDVRAEEKAAAQGKTLQQEQVPSHRFYTKHKRQMDKGAETSWPAVRSLYWLMRQRAKNLRAFNKEMNGEAKGDDDYIFTRWNFWVQRLHHWVFYGACDPSMGKTEKSHPSALLVGGFDKQKQKLHVVEARIKRRVPSILHSDLIKLQKEYPIVSWAFENNNAYEHMRISFITEAMRRGVTLSLIGVPAIISQHERIESLEPLITDIDPQILFDAGLKQLLDEMGTFPEPQSHHHYDGLVGLHLLWEIAVRGGRGIPNIRTGKSRAQQTLRGYDSGYQ